MQYVCRHSTPSHIVRPGRTFSSFLLSKRGSFHAFCDITDKFSGGTFSPF